MTRPADIFKLKASERGCTRCGEGKLYVERISDLKAKHYCDNCDWFEIYSNEPEPMTVIPTQPLPESMMPRTNTTGLKGNDYTRWINAGKPDVEAFKKAGCPTPSQWNKLQAGPPEAPPESAAQTDTTKPRRKKRTKRKPTSTQHPAPRAPRPGNHRGHGRDNARRACRVHAFGGQGEPQRQVRLV